MFVLGTPGWRLYLSSVSIVSTAEACIDCWINFKSLPLSELKFNSLSDVILHVCFCYIVLNCSYFNTFKAVLIERKHCQIEICSIFVYFCAHEIAVWVLLLQTILKEHTKRWASGICTLLVFPVFSREVSVCPAKDSSVYKRVVNPCQLE